MGKEKLNITYIDASGDFVRDDSIIKGENYTIDDCILIRTTDVFPFDGVVKVPKNDNAYEFGDSSIFVNAIFNIIRSKYSSEYLNEEEEQELDKELSEYKVVFETCRSTIHFTLNGLVSSSMYGNFDNRAYVIFDGLKHHLDKSLMSLRVEDTYFNEDMSLSDEACILISTEVFKLLSTNVECMESLEKFGRIFIYDGSQTVAVKKVLEILGYDAFLVGDHTYTNSDKDFSPAMRMTQFVHQLAIKYNFGREKHFCSKISETDKIALLAKAEEIEKLHLFYIIDNSNLDENLVELIKDTLANGDYNRKLKGLITELIYSVGLERIKQLTKEFNELYIQNLNSTKSKVHF